MNFILFCLYIFLSLVSMIFIILGTLNRLKYRRMNKVESKVVKVEKEIIDSNKSGRIKKKEFSIVEYYIEEKKYIKKIKTKDAELNDSIILYINPKNHSKVYEVKYTTYFIYGFAIMIFMIIISIIIN